MLMDTKSRPTLLPLSLLMNRLPIKLDEKAGPGAGQGRSLSPAKHSSRCWGLCRSVGLKKRESSGWVIRLWRAHPVLERLGNGDENFETHWIHSPQICGDHAMTKPKSRGGEGIWHSSIYRGVVAERGQGAGEKVEGGHGGGTKDDGEVLVVSYMLTNNWY